MTTEYIIGPRQTVDRALHPTLGEGRAVYDNGPALFIPDAGEPVPMRSIDLGGASSEPHRSWLVARTLDGQRIEMETTDRARGDRHSRRWHPMHGAGWLVLLGRKMDRACPMRFDPDDGRPFEMIVHVMAVGRPAFAATAFTKRREKAYKNRDPEEDHWTTYTLASGETVAFRYAAPSSDVAADTATPAPGTLPPRETSTPIARAQAGYPPPNATRAEIDAWVKHTNRSLP